MTTNCNSGEYQRSLTISIGRSLPISPAGIVIVVRVPSASTPSIVCLPSCSVTTLFAPGAVLKTYVPATPPSALIVKCSGSGAGNGDPDGDVRMTLLAVP